MKTNFDILNKISLRAHYLAIRMIFEANNRSDVEKGDPKVGGHSSASASALHIMGALHLHVKTGFDVIANKPHASPVDHAYNYLLNLLLDEQHNPLSPELAAQAMAGLRAFSQNGEPVFQSYHSHYDSDHHNFLPSGTVGIPPVQAGYLAQAYKYLAQHKFKVPNAHFWSLIGDSEFREGSLYEAMPDFAERELGNLTWMVDYNRQSLDGQRMSNREVMGGNDDIRLENTARANGWQVIQVKHGSFRQELFQRPKGELFKNLLDQELEDVELQALLLINDSKALFETVSEKHKSLAPFLKNTSAEDLKRGLSDFAGHDFGELIKAMEDSKKEKQRPTLLICHTLKGWGLKMAASASNHSSLPSEEEVDALMTAQGGSKSQLFPRFADKTPEALYLKERGTALLKDIHAQHALKEQNQAQFAKSVVSQEEFPKSLNINLKMANYPHTQWMLGQYVAKLTRIANASENLKTDEQTWKHPSELLVSMAPDVGTSTNLNPAMDGKIFSSNEIEDFEEEFEVKDRKAPDLIPGVEVSDRFLRFEIAEGNAMSCLGSFGKVKDLLGIPLLPLMTVYDFFVKRALDQFFYIQYWRSNFILVGTPSGVSLSPEGAQHGWKSDLQVPNQITWEPTFCIELDWILSDAIRRHMYNDNEGRTGVFIRGTTRGIDQKLLAKYLATQRRFKTDLADGQLLAHAEFPLAGATSEKDVANLPEEQMLEAIRHDVLEGGYYLIDYRGYANYEPGDNVINILVMGALTPEATKASDLLLAKGIYANVIVVTNTDLLVGHLGAQNQYQHLRQTLGITGQVYLAPVKGEKALSEVDLLTLEGKRIPIVSVHDGEPGLLDNIGSIVGARHEALAVRKHSKCGRPADIYKYHGLDAENIVATSEQLLTEGATERFQVSPQILSELMARR